MTGKILVTGISGQQGGATARELLAHKATFRGLSRDPSKLKELKQKGVELVQGDLQHKESLKKALEGIESAYLMTTWFEGGVDEEVKQGKTFIDAAKSAGVKHIVYSSVAAADEKTGIPHFESKWKVEQSLHKSGISWTMVRPVFFMENFGAPWLLPSFHSGKLTLPLHKETLLCMVSLDTIGRFAAAALLDPKTYAGKTITLVSDCLTLPQALEQINAVTGGHVTYEELPEKRAQQLYGPDVATMYRWFNEVGYTDTRSELKSYGLPLTTFKEHLKQAHWLSKLKAAAGVS